MKAYGQVLMSEKALSRLQVIEKLLAKRLNQKQAANLLGIGTRQIRRLVFHYWQTTGALRLASRLPCGVCVLIE